MDLDEDTPHQPIPSYHSDDDEDSELASWDKTYASSDYDPEDPYEVPCTKPCYLCIFFHHCPGDDA
jgi:hypothetical protein